MDSKFLFYLRFSLILPASFVGAVLGQGIVVLISYINSIPDWSTHLIGSTIIGMLFVLSGLWMSPKKTPLIANILLIIFSVISVGIFIFSLSGEYDYNIWLLILNLIVGILGAFYATNIVRD